MRVAVVVVALALLAGCGRIGFDLTGSPSDDSGGSGSSTGDGGGSNGDGGGSATADAMPDAQPVACATAMTLQFNMPVAISTCAGNNDRFDGCAGSGTFEVVFKFTAPSSGSYTFRARDAGTQNVSNSTGIINGGCTATTNCVGVSGQPLSAGQVMYFAIEASSGGCANIEFEAI